MISKDKARYVSLGLGAMGVIWLFVSAYLWKYAGVSKSLLTGAVACLAMSPILLLIYRFNDRRWWPGAFLATGTLTLWFVAVVFMIWSEPFPVRTRVFKSIFIITGFSLLMVPALNIRKDKGALLPSVVGVLGCLLTCGVYLLSTWDGTTYTYDEWRHELQGASLLSYGSIGVVCLYWIMTERGSFRWVAVLGAGVSLAGMGFSAYYTWFWQVTQSAQSINAWGFRLLILLGIVRVLRHKLNLSTLKKFCKSDSEGGVEVP